MRSIVRVVSPGLAALACAAPPDPISEAEGAAPEPAGQSVDAIESPPDTGPLPWSPEISSEIYPGLRRARPDSWRIPLGWLSDPEASPRDTLDALTGGKVHFDNRLRIEFADTTGRNSSTAITNRIRLGYESKPWHGFSGLIEMENVSSPSRDSYWVPATGEGTSDRTAIGDPTGTEVNRASARFTTPSADGSEALLDLQAGRQRIMLDDSRFVGNVGWRQFEQTFDAVSVRTGAGVPGLSVFYAYVWGVQRVSGPDGLNPESDSHLLNIAYQVDDDLKLTGFAYLLDFRDDEPQNSTSTVGLRASGDLWQFFSLVNAYELTWAYQTDAGSNPISYDAMFLAVETYFESDGDGLRLPIVGYQFLGSDDGDAAFRFPLGTNHKFQGFADNFLNTPAAGLQDLYLAAEVPVPWRMSWKVGAAYHLYWTDQSGDYLGQEVNAVWSMQISPIWSVLIKGAYFNGHAGQPDTVRLWMQTTLSF